MSAAELGSAALYTDLGYELYVVALSRVRLVQMSMLFSRWHHRQGESINRIGLQL